MKVRKKKKEQEDPQKKLKRKKKLKRLLRWIKSLLITALLVTTLVYSALSPFFNIGRIVTKGSAHYNTDTLAAISGIREGENGFRVLYRDPGRAYVLRFESAEEAILKSCPYVKDVKARFVLPDTVSIEIKEREAAAILSMRGTSLLIDKEGYLLEITPDMSGLDLPVIKGITLNAYQPGQKLGIQEEVLSTAFRVYDAIERIDATETEKLTPGVDYVDVADLYNVSFSLDERVEVNLGEAEDLHYKITAAKTIFTNNIKKNEKGKLDFSFNENPVFTPENGG